MNRETKILSPLIAAEHLTQEIVDKADALLANLEKAPLAVVSPKPQTKGKSHAEYKKAWQEKNREHYLEKNRQYVAAHRARKKLVEQ